MREVNLFEKEKGPPYHDNVLNMGEFLFKRHTKLDVEYDRLNAQADALSKQDKDKFAAPVRAKAESIKAIMDKVSDQLKFIIRGGLPQPAPHRGSIITDGPCRVGPCISHGFRQLFSNIRDIRLRPIQSRIEK